MWPNGADHGLHGVTSSSCELPLSRLQWQHTAEAHNKLLIYGSAFGHKKHAVFIVFNQLEKISRAYKIDAVAGDG